VNREVIVKQGKDGEAAFQEWLNFQELGFLRVDQDWESMPAIFKNSVKRPDYLLLLASIGFIAIDVKNSKLNGSYFTLQINGEIDRSIAFEHYTRIYLWYAFKNKDTSNNDEWYFVSAHKACEVGLRKYNKKRNVYYYEIELKYFEKITRAEDLGKLFNARIGMLGKFTRAVEHGFRSIKDGVC